METKVFNIVIADSQPIIIQGLTALFKEDIHYQVKGFTNNGEELKKILEEDASINTLIIELRLPNTNILRLIKDIVVVHSDVKIIAFTQYTIPNLMQKIMELGTHAFLSKNATLPDILETMERVHRGEYFIGQSVFFKDTDNNINDNIFLHNHEDKFAKFAELTEREMDVVILLSRGYRNKLIATTLHISIYTVETHRKNIMKKIKLKTVGQLIYHATQQGIV